MEREYIEERLVNFIDRAVLDGQGSGLTASTPLFALGLLDSFALFRIIAFIVEEFQVTVKLESLRSEDFESVSAIAGFVTSMLGTGQDAARWSVKSW